MRRGRLDWYDREEADRAMLAAIRDRMSDVKAAAAVGVHPARSSVTGNDIRYRRTFGSTATIKAIRHQSGRLLLYPTRYNPTIPHWSLHG